MKDFIRLLLLFFGFLYGANQVYGQCNIENFTLTPTTGTCASNAKITVQLPAGCAPNDWEAVLYKQDEATIVNRLDIPTAGSVTFNDLVPDTYKVQLVNKNTPSKKSAFKQQVVTTTYKQIRGANVKLTQKPPTCQDGEDGIVGVDIENTVGTGPYEIIVYQGTNPDGTRKRVATTTANKGVGGSTRIEVKGGVGTNIIKTGDVFVEIIDLINNEAGCRASTGPIYKTYVATPRKNPTWLTAFLKPTQGYQKFDVLYAVVYQDGPLLQNEGELHIEINRGGTIHTEVLTTAANTYTITADDVPSIFNHSALNSSTKFIKGTISIQKDDKVKMTYKDFCPNTADVEVTIDKIDRNPPTTPAVPALAPISEIKTTTTAGCQITGREITIGRAYRAHRTNYQRYATNSVYSQFCEKEIIVRLMKETAPGTWTPQGAEQEYNIGHYMQGTSDLNVFSFPQTFTLSSNGKYRIEAYVKSNTGGTDKSDCKYFSYDFDVNNVGQVLGGTIGGITLQTPPNPNEIFTLLEGTSPGVRVYLDAPQNGGRAYSTTNPLTLRISPKNSADRNNPAYTKFITRGPLSLADQPSGQTTYTITYPKEVKVVSNGHFMVYDLPPGEYTFEFLNGCDRLLKDVTIKSNPARYNPNDQIIKASSCTGGGTIEYNFFDKVNLGAGADPEYYNNDGIGGKPLRQVRARYYMDVRIFKDKSTTGPTNVAGVNSNVVLSYDDAKAREGSQAMAATSRSDGWKGVFSNVPPGRYLVRFRGMEYDRIFTVVDNPTNGYASEKEAPENWNAVKWTTVYYPIEIPAIISKPQIDYIASLCDPADSQTGLIQVELKAGQKITYPLKYELLLDDGTPAKDNTNTIIPIHKVNTENDAVHTFTKIPRLTAPRSYKIRVYDSCGGYEDFAIVNFETRVPEIRGADTVCPNTEMTLEIHLQSSVYNILWEGPIPAGVDKTKRTITFTPTGTGTYKVRYTPKDATTCGGSAGPFYSQEKTITVKTDTGNPVITGTLPDKVFTVNTGDCTVFYSWTSPTATDPEDCFKSLTWRVEDAAGNKIHPTSGENNESVATNWNFPIGTSTVVYTALDTSGNKSELRFKVTVNPSVISINLSNAYVSSSNVVISDIGIGGDMYYKVSLRNTGVEDLKDVVVTVTLPMGSHIELPVATGVNVTDLGGAPNVVYTAGTGTYTISNIPNGAFTRNSSEKHITFPIKVRGNCSDYGGACQNELTSKVVVSFSGGNVNCPVVGQTSRAEKSIKVNTELSCSRQELYCGGSQVLTTTGTGYTSYEWYLNGVVIAGATGSSYTATQAGTYRVERKVDCGGHTVSNPEIIHLLNGADLVTNDPIKAQANGGATCGNDGIWVSHFFLCDGTSKTINVTFNNAQKLSWQKYNTTCTYTKANCQSRLDSCWSNVVEDVRSFTLSAEGNYRLRVTGNGCTQDFYFTVYTSGLGGVVTARNQDDNVLGAVTITMDTSGQPYTYVLKDGGTEVARATVTNHEHTFSGLVIPKGTSKTYTVEVTSSAIPGCKFTKTVVVEDKTTMKVKGEFLTWVDCADGNFKFEVEGGRAAYKVAIYSIDGTLQHPSASTLEHIPDSAFTSGSNQTTFTEKFTITTPGGYYRFVVRDSSGQNILTDPILVPHNPNYQVESSATDIICAEDKATITARFLPSLGVAQTVELYRGSVSAANKVGENNSGIFPGLSAGKYIAIVKTRLGKVCQFERTIEVKRLFEPLVGFVGVEKDILCEPTKGYKININNVSGGKAPYTYSFEGGNVGTYSNSHTGYISNSTSVFVKDANGCVLELEVKVDPALQQPTIPADLHPLITYDCEGNARLTITPVTPTGKTYIYEYELDGNASTNSFILPPKAGGGSYTINIYYKDANATTIQSNVLLREDFGTGADVCNTNYVPLACTPSVALIDGTYTITSQLQASAEYGFPAAGVVSGRYLAGVPTPTSKVLYERLIKNVIPQKSVSVSLKYINLLLTNTIGKVNPSLRVELVVGGTTYTRTLSAVAKNVNWVEQKLEFTELGVPTQIQTEATLRIISDASTSTAVGLDDILVSQKTEECRVPITRVVTPQAGKNFNPVVVDVQDAKCEGEKGKVFVEVTNNGGATSLDYSVDGGTTWKTANLVTGSTTRYVFEELAGTYQVKFKRDACVVTAPATVEIKEPKPISIPTAKISATKIGCVAPFLTSTVTMTIEGGTRPYASIRYRESGTTTWQTTGAIVTNNTAIVSGLAGGKTYEFTVTDANNCSVNEVMGTYTTPVKEDVTIETEHTLCYREGEGEIKIKVLTGAGPYKFSRDNGVTFEYNPDDINATEMTYEGLDAGTYQIVVEDALGCKVNKTIIIYPTLTLQLTSDNGFDCSATPKEKITLEANGGKGAHTFKWRQGTTGAYRASTDSDGGKVVFGTPTVTGNRTVVEVIVNQVGLYYFEVSDENVDAFGEPCKVSQVVDIKIVKPEWKAGVQLAADDILCEGASTGFIGVRPTGGGTIREINLTTDIDGSKGVYPFTILVYKKVGGVVDETTNVGTRNLPAGTYVVRLKDAKGCVSTDVEVVIGEKPKVNVTSVKDADVSCAGAGTFNYGKLTASWTAGGTPPFTASLYTASGVLARKVSGAVHQYTNKQQTETIIFDELISGTYTVVLVDANGCRVETAPIEIAGLATDIVVEPQPANCTTASVKIITYNKNTAIDPTKVKVAIYKGGDPATYPTTDWILATGSTYMVGGVSVISAEATIGNLLPGATYRFVVNDNGCYSISEAKTLQQQTTTKVDTVTSYVACTGNDGKIGFTLSNIPAGVTSISYQIYKYPDNTTIGAGTSIPVGTPGTLTYTEPANTLPAGEYYVVITEGGTNCITASKPFTITQPDTPLSVDLQLTKNENCTDSAHLLARVTGGKGGYKYIFKSQMGLPTDAEWAAKTADTKRQVEETSGVHTALTLTGDWYVYVKDANGCVVEKHVQIVKDDSPIILSAVPENLCATNGNYHVRVTMTQLGAGQHYYTITRNGVTSSLRPIAFTTNGLGQQEFVITNVYADANAQEVKVYDFNKCPSAGMTFNLNSRLTYDVSVTRKLTCTTTPDAEITINNFSKVGLTYKYKVVEVVTQTNIDPITGQVTQSEQEVREIVSLTAGTTPSQTFTVSSAGKYKIYVYDNASPDCPITKTVIVNHKELPIVSQVSVIDEECPSTTSVGVGTGKITVLAGSLGIGGFRFRITHAVDLTNNSTVTGIPTGYTTPTNLSVPGVVEIDASGTTATYEKLKGTPQGIRYYIVATSTINECESIPLQVTVRAPFPIEVAPNSVTVTQFACNASQELQNAKISLNTSGVSGGTAPYTYIFKQGTTIVQESKTSDLLVYDKAGGTYTIEIKDTNGCIFVVPSTYTINPYISIESIKATKQTGATCTTGESVQIEITTDPIGGIPANGYYYRIEKAGVIQEKDNEMSRQWTFTNLEVGHYKVTVRNKDTGCEIYTSYQVQDPNTFVVTASDEKRVKCFGGSDGEITLTFTDTDHDNGDQALAGFSYTITNIYDTTMSPITGTATGNTTTVTGLKAGTYKVVATSTATGCETRLTSQFSIRQAYEALTGSATREYEPTCTNDQGEILVGVLGGVTPYTIKITGDNGYTETVTDVYDKHLFTGLGGANTPGIATYTITVTDAWGCTITLTDQPQLERPADIAISYNVKNPTCVEGDNGSVNLTSVTGGSGAGTYYYELEGVTNTRYYLQRNTLFEGLIAGTYKLTVTDRWGCKKEEQITLVDPSKVVIREVDKSEAVCYEDTTGFIVVQVSGGTPGTAGYTVELVNSVTGIPRGYKDGVQPNTDVRFDDLSPKVKYEIRIVDSEGCRSKDVHSFELVQLPDLTTKIEYVESCVSNTYEGKIMVAFSETLDWTRVRYAINSTNLSDSKSFDGSELNVAYINVDATTPKGEQMMTIFYVQPSAMSKPDIVCSKASNKYFVRDHKDLLIEEDTRYELAVNELKVQGKFGVEPYTYYFNEQYAAGNSVYLVKRTDPEEAHPVTGKMMKVIEARVEDALGCTSILKLYYEYIDVYIPNFFTPTGDSINDGWRPEYTVHYPNMSVEIYDRYGRFIIRLSQGQKWDGKYQGKELPAGDYWYILKLNAEDDPREFKGNFTLYR